MTFTLSYATTGTYTAYCPVKYYGFWDISFTVKKYGGNFWYYLVDPLEIGFDNDSSGTYRAFACFDFSEIPGNATVIDVDLSYDCISNVSSDQSVIKECKLDPVNCIRNPFYSATYYNHYDENVTYKGTVYTPGDTYVSASSFPVLGNNIVDLGADAVSNFQNVLGVTDNYAIIIACGDESKRILIDKNMTLVVTYESAASVNLYPPDPVSLDYTHNRDIVVKNYTNGERRALDKGGTGRTLVINGVSQGANGSALMGSLRDFERFHQDVTISNLTSFLNTTWKIKGFNSRRRAGNILDWDLNLERND